MAAPKGRSRHLVVRVVVAFAVPSGAPRVSRATPSRVHRTEWSGRSDATTSARLMRFAQIRLSRRTGLSRLALTIASRATAKATYERPGRARVARVLRHEGTRRGSDGRAIAVAQTQRCGSAGPGQSRDDRIPRERSFRRARSRRSLRRPSNRPGSPRSRLRLASEFSPARRRVTKVDRQGCRRRRLQPRHRFCFPIG